MYAPKVSPKPLNLIFVISSTKPMHAYNSLENKKLKDKNQKSFTELAWFFLSNPVSYYEQDYEKEKRPGTMWPF